MLNIDKRKNYHVVLANYIACYLYSYIMYIKIMVLDKHWLL